MRLETFHLTWSQWDQNFLEVVKFIYSEKATNFCKISTVDLSYVVTVKSTVEISQNFVAFSEYMNFNGSGKACTKVKFIYSEKAAKFCEISTVDLTVTT